MARRQDLAQQRLTSAQAVNRQYTSQLEDVSNALLSIREQIDSMGTKMSDVGPVHTLRVALRRLKSEIRDMQNRIGVVQSQLWAHHRRKSGLQ